MSLHPQLTPILRPDPCPDARRVAELHARLFPEPWTEAEFQGLLASPAAALFWLLEEPVGETDSQALGFILLNIVLDEAEILTLGIHPERRRQGLARLMLNATATQLAARGVTRLLLEVDMSNRPALALYARSGFETIAIRKAYYHHDGIPPTDAYVMRKKLRDHPLT